MSGYVSPYGTASSSDTPPPTYKSPYATATAEPAKTTYQSPYATGAFADPKHKPAFDTSGLDRSIAQQDENLKKPVAGAFGLLQRVPDAWDATLTGGNPGAVLTGNATDDDKAKTAGRVDSALSKFPGGSNPTVRGAYHLGMNPLNLLDLPLGVAAKGRNAAQLAVDAAEGHGFNLATKAGNALSNAGAKPVTDLIAKGHDLLGVHSAAKRELAALHGPQWIDKYAEYRARLMQMGGKPDAELEAQAAREAAKASGAPKPRISAADAAAAIAKAKAPAAFNPEDEKIFALMADSTKGAKPKNALLDAASVPSDLLTAGMFAQPLGHMANISGLGAMTDPLAVAGAFARGTVDNAKKAFGKGETAEEIAARHAPARAGGALPSHATERDNILVQGLDKAADVAKKIPVAGQALALIPKGVAKLYRASGDILWKFDDEVKAQRFQHLVDGGMEPSRAGLRVGGELVDYENKSPIGKGLRPIAPFSTWRTKAPLAVARNAVENPGKTSALSNAAPAAMGGTQGTDPDTGKPYISSLPGAEFNTLTSGAQGAAKYGTGTIGSVPRIAGDLAAAAFAMREPDTPRGRAAQKKARTQFTYGQEPGTFLLNELPIVQQIMQYGSAGMFNKGQAPSTLNDLLSLIRVRPGSP